MGRWLKRVFRNLFARPREWNCRCGWHGETCNWSDGGRTVDEFGHIHDRAFAPICPECGNRI